MSFRLESVLIPCLSAVAPFRCPVCGKPPFDGTPGMFCAECLESLPFIAPPYCPGCGGTRAVHALLHGHPLKALRYNAILLPGAVCAGLVWKYPKLQTNKPFAYTVATVFILFFILRNIPCYPFSLLAPPSF